jgi:hypothetical protein
MVVWFHAMAKGASSIKILKVHVYFHPISWEYFLHKLLSFQGRGQGKGGLISESFSLWLKSPKKVPNYSPEHLHFRWIVLCYLHGSDLARIFGDLSQIINFRCFSRGYALISPSFLKNSKNARG